jgi:ketosteroid isomerase-like protein
MPTEHKQIVETYIEGFRRGDREMILDCLTEDVTWHLLGFKTLTGKVQFAGEIQNEATVGTPELFVQRLVEEDDVVIALGGGNGQLKDGGRLEFVFCDAFFFEGSKIRRVDSYVVNLHASAHLFDAASN